MDLLSLITAFSVVALSTLILFRSFRMVSSSIIFNKDEALSIQSRIRSSFGSIAVLSNIFGTLTSVATVYVFFVGSSKIFGFAIYFAPISVAISFVVTNWLTAKALGQRPAFSKMLKESDRTSGIVARLIWEPSVQGRAVSAIVKWISIINILSVLWLEFSVFGDIASRTLNNTYSIINSSILVLILAFVIFFIVIKYGLRGFVVADILHAPFVVIGTLSVLSGLVALVFGRSDFSWDIIVIPQIPVAQAVAFVIHVFALNMFFVLLTEGHWFRLWLFGSDEITHQATGTLSTGTIWMLLAVAGCLAAAVTPNAGVDGIIPILNTLGSTSSLLPFLFWFGASAAVFSAADAQIFNLIMVWNFQPVDGSLSSKIDRPNSPFKVGVSFAVVYGLIFMLTRYLGIPLEKLIFTLFPICLNILPSFISIVFQRRLRAIWIILSIVFYSAFNIIGLIRPEDDYLWTLIGAIVPVVVSSILIVVEKPSNTPVGVQHG